MIASCDLVLAWFPGWLMICIESFLDAFLILQYFNLFSWKLTHYLLDTTLIHCLNNR